jgi:hypothetical protein
MSGFDVRGRTGNIVRHAFDEENVRRSPTGFILRDVVVQGNKTP